MCDRALWSCRSVESCDACRVSKLMLLFAMELCSVYWGGWPGPPLCASCARRSGGRQLDFLGLNGTMLSKGDAGWFAGALNSLPARDPAAEPEIIKILQVRFQSQYDACS